MKKPHINVSKDLNVMGDVHSKAGLDYTNTHLYMWYKLVSAFFILWFGLLLIYGVTSAVTNEFYQFIFFVRHPAVLVLNGITLCVLLCHSFYWFSKRKVCSFKAIAKGTVGLGIAIMLMAYLVKIIMR